ncbi:hypothetical protein F4801DRAFT_441841 [Xylaria longipes]|nr:hypothetical protein F4801DRAFT_441841 [Xylaria longipes]
MPSAPQLWTVVGLLGLSANGVNGGALYHYPYYNVSSCSTTIITLPTTYKTYPSSSTIVSPTTVVSTYPTTVTSEYPTTILNTTTTTTSVPVTVTDNSTVYYPTVVPTTSVSSTTVIVPTTITPPVSYSTITPTITTSIEEECPTTCSIVAGTVRLFFWPTNNDYTYPSTYVETGIDYTFTSPSVYLVINTIYGTNSIGRAGPSGTSEIFAVDIDQVSTILPGPQITRQLTLNDLHTDCPQSLDPEVIATTIPDGHCDFSLLAPETVKQWALPCNACGRLGLFDPPYAIPTLGGGLIGTTITTTNVETTTFASTTSPASGATSTIVTATTTTVAQTTETSAIPSSGNPAIPSSGNPSDSSSGNPSDSSSGNPTASSSGNPTAPSSGNPTAPSSSLTSDPTTVPTASAARVTGLCGAAWLFVSCFVIFWL